MKFLIVCLLLPLTIILPSTSADTAGTIYIMTADDDVAAFRTIGKIFNSAGYDLEDSEEALMVVTTEIMKKDYGVFNLKKLAIKLKAAINMSDSLTIISLSGQYLDGGGERNSELSENYFDKYSRTIVQTGAPDSAEKAAWDSMMQIAQKYRNGKIKTER